MIPGLLVGAALLTGVAAYAAVMLLILGVARVASSPTPNGRAHSGNGEGEAGGQQEEHEGERVRPDLGAEEPQQGEQRGGDVADEGDHAPPLPRLRLI